MMKLRNIAVVASVAASLALPSAALASGGGVNSGGVSSGGVNSGGVNSGGSATGGGGGGGGGGSTTTAPASCISNFASTDGYYSVWAAIWTNWGVSLQSCRGAASWDMTYTNGNTGAVDFERSAPIGKGLPTSGLVDEDWAGFSTPYTVTFTVSDNAGNALASQSAVVNTKAPKSPGA